MNRCAPGVLRIDIGGPGFAGHERRSHRRQTLSSHASAVAQDGAPALAGVAAEEAVLPFAANF